MSRHILLMDPIENLDVKKDSSLLFALSLQKKGHNVFLLFEEQFYFSNYDDSLFQVSSFSGDICSETFQVKNFLLEENEHIKMGEGDIIHMRIDPPFDTRYLRQLWLLNSLKKDGVKIINDPSGIMLNNEKLYAYDMKESLPSYIGRGVIEFERFIQGLRDAGDEYVILKPMDLYQGIGVEKCALDDPKLTTIFKNKVIEFSGVIIAQKYEKCVEDGEVRSIFYGGKELGSILKIPRKGDFLSNIARGASFKKTDLSSTQRELCQKIANDLLKINVPWIAFDILGDSISEVNITCPGLLVEVSKAMKRNLALEIADSI